jgi:glutamate/aspartate transport system substrate-binding protein
MKACSTILALALSSSAACAGPVLDRIKSTGKVVIGHRESSVPFSYYDANKRPVGYAIDLCTRIVEATRKHLGLAELKIEYTLVTSANRIQFITDGKADLECGSTTNNAERRKQVAFTIPHYITGARYLVRADSPIAELTQFENRKLISTKGSTPLKAIDQANRQGLLRIQIGEAPDHARAVEMVENNEADGFAMDDVLLYGLMSNRPDPTKLKVVGKFLTIEPLAIMLSKDDPELKRIADDEMRRLIKDTREAYAIYDKWFTRPIAPNGRSLALPMNYLLRDFWKFPSDSVPF